MWPFRRRAESAPEPSAPASAAGAPPVQREAANGWAVVGMNVQRAIGPMPLTYLSSGVSEIMPTHHDPSVSGSMGHAVSADAPSGVVRGLATTVSAEHDSWGSSGSMSLRQPRLAEEPAAPETPTRWLPVSQPADAADDSSASPVGDDSPSPVTASDPEPPRTLHATSTPASAGSSHHVQRAATTSAPTASTTTPSAPGTPAADHSALLHDLPPGAVVPDQPLTLADVEARYTGSSATAPANDPDLAPPIQPRQVQRKAVGGEPPSSPPVPGIRVSRSIEPSAAAPSAIEPTVSRSAEEHFPGDGHDHGEGDAHEGGGPVQRMALASTPPATPSSSTSSSSPVATPRTPTPDAAPPANGATTEHVAPATEEADAPLVGEQPLAPSVVNDSPATTDSSPVVSREATADALGGGAGGAEALGPLAALGGQGGGLAGALGGGGAGGEGGEAGAQAAMPIQMEAVQRASLAAPAPTPSPAARPAPSAGDAAGSHASLGSSPEPAGHDGEGAPAAAPPAPPAPAEGPPSVGTASDPAVPTLGVNATGPNAGGPAASGAPATTSSAAAATAIDASTPDLPLTVARLASMPSVQRSAAPVGQRAVAIQSRPTTPLVSVSREAQPHTVPPAVQRMVEQRTGADLSDVVVHRQTGEQARSMSAHAFTHNGEVHIPDHHGPLDSGPGQSLLAHELTHVAQQRQLGDRRPPESTPAGQALEAQAQHSELAVAGGAASPAPVTVSRLAEASVQRLPSRRSGFTLASHRVSASAPAPATEDEKQPEEQAPQPPEPAPPPPPPMALASPAAPGGGGSAGEDEKQSAQPAPAPEPQPAPQASSAGEDEKQSQPENNIVGATAAPVPSAQPGAGAAAAVTGGAAGAAGGGGGGAGDELDELARKLYDKIRWRMRAELRMDLERGGRGAGINH